MSYILDEKNMSSYDILLQNCRERAMYIIQNYDKTEKQIREKLAKTNIAKSNYYRRIIKKDAKIMEDYICLDAEQDKYGEAHYPEKVIDDTVEFLLRHHFIDDEAYAKRYIESHCRAYSKKVIKQKLLLKGINREIIDSIYEESDDEGQEEAVAKKLLLKKCPDYYEIRDDETKLDRKAKAKLMAYLVRKGFDYSLVSDIMKV